MQYKYHNIIFDLDGTLINSGPGIIHAVQYALKKYGINETDMTVLKSFVGPPLNQQFINCYNFSHEQSLEAVKYFREYYTDKGILENEVYEQIPELLKILAENGLKLLIASSKPEKFVKNILSQHDLLKYFAFAGGSLLDGSRINKDDVLAYVLKQMQITNLNDCIMVGDRKYDVIGAKKFNLKCVGVTYGYGSLEELKDYAEDGYGIALESTNRLLYRTLNHREKLEFWANGELFPVDADSMQIFKALADGEQFSLNDLPNQTANLDATFELIVEALNFGILMLIEPIESD